MYYTSTAGNPSAFIVNSGDRGRKKIYLNSKVYLDNNQEFLIELFNPLQDSVLAEIKINGKIESANGLILRPGQRFYLDCSINDKRKFIFKTYEIENTQEAAFATANNGYVEVTFFKEKQKYYPQTLNNPTWTVQTPNVWTFPGSVTLCSTSGGAANLSGITTNSCYTSNSLNNMTIPTGMRSKSISDTTETGRIEKGASSNQKFESVSMEFETYCLNRVSYQILPNSKKPVETSEVKKNFCSECGHKLKGSERFCPSCGARL